MDREQDPVASGDVDLVGQECVQRGAPHHGCVDDLAREHREVGLEHRHVAVGVDVLDPDRAVGGDRHRLLGGLEVAVVHRHHA